MTTISLRTIRAGFLACAFAMAAMASTSQAVAQTPQMTVKVPFPFHNGSQILPAGEYTVSLNSDHLILLRGPSGGGFAMTNPEEARTPSKNSRISFRKYGDRYFVHEVWLIGSNTGVECVKTKSEKRAQTEEIAKNAVAPSDVELAMNVLPR